MDPRHLEDDRAVFSAEQIICQKERPVAVLRGNALATRVIGKEKRKALPLSNSS